MIVPGTGQSQFHSTPLTHSGSKEHGERKEASEYHVLTHSSKAWARLAKPSGHGIRELSDRTHHASIDTDRY